MSRPLPNLGPTRRSLHGVAELVLAGPEYRTSGTIRLRVVPDGFTTLREPSVLVENGRLAANGGSVPIDGRTCAELAAAVGVEVGAPADVYHDGSGVAPDEKLVIDTDALIVLMDGYDTGRAALERFAPDIQAILWPEHFDMSITLDEVDYGVSPGDQFVAEPYAYVSPAKPPADPFFNQTFGASRPLRELGNADAVVTFYTEARRRTTA